MLLLITAICLLPLGVDATPYTYESRPHVVIDNLLVDKTQDEVKQLNIAYGSCYGINDMRSDIFKTISGIRHNISAPDLFIWGGDAVYADEFGSFLLGENQGYTSIEFTTNQFTRV